MLAIVNFFMQNIPIVPIFVHINGISILILSLKHKFSLDVGNILIPICRTFLVETAKSCSLDAWDVDTPSSWQLGSPKFP